MGCAASAVAPAPASASMQSDNTAAVAPLTPSVDEQSLLKQAAEQLKKQEHNTPGASLWGPSVEASQRPQREEFVPFRKLEMVRPINELCNSMDNDSTRVTRLLPQVVPLYKQFLTTLLSDANTEDNRFKLAKVYNEKRSASLQLYGITLEKCKRDPCYSELHRSLRVIQIKLNDIICTENKKLRWQNATKHELNELHFVPRSPRKQTKPGIAALLADAKSLKTRFDAFLREICDKTGAASKPGPIKGVWRMLEKVLIDSVVELKLDVGSAEADASRVCDVLRGSVVGQNSAQLDQVLLLLRNLDEEIGDLSLSGGITERIQILALKDRLSRPTTGGWADIMVYVRFTDDVTAHVCELQLQLAPMQRVRTDMNGHHDFAIFRCASELLTALGYPPEAPDEEKVVASGSEAVEQLEVTARTLTQQVSELQQQLGRVLDSTGLSKTATGGADARGLILSFGNPLLDVNVIIKPNFLDDFDLKISDAILVEDLRKDIDYQNLLARLRAEGQSVQISSGGSTQNTIRVAQWISGDEGATAFVGCIGDDDNGRLLEETMQRAGCKTCYLKTNAKSTGTCAVMGTTSNVGTERSMVTDLSAAREYTFAHFKEHVQSAGLLARAQFVYCAGYFLTVCPEVIIEVAKHTTASGKTLAINLSAAFIVESFTNILDSAIYYCNFVFGNAEEIQLYGKCHGWGEDVSGNATKMADLPSANPARPRVVVITQGEEKTIVVCAGVVTAHPVAPLPGRLVHDTTGAGDAFTGGFLATLRKGGKLSECVTAGHYAAKEIIRVSGVVTPNFCLVPNFVRPSIDAPMIVGFGNPLLDVSVIADQAMFDLWKVTAGTAILADETHHRPLFPELLKRADKVLAGGSAMNTIRVAQWMSDTTGVTAFVGCVGADKEGNMLEQSASSDGVQIRFLRHKSESTGKCAVLVNDDGERGMCTDLVAANCYDKAHFDSEPIQALVRNAKVIYFAGFFLTQDGGYETALALARGRRTGGYMLCVNLSAAFIAEVPVFKQRLDTILPFADVVFGNESEAAAYARASGWPSDDLHEVARKLAASNVDALDSETAQATMTRPRLAVVTCGKDDTITSLGGAKVRTFDVMPVKRLVDTTGAGDSVAGGFLAKLITGASLEDCVRAGQYAAAQIVQVSGCKMPTIPVPKFPYLNDVK